MQWLGVVICVVTRGNRVDREAGLLCLIKTLIKIPYILSPVSHVYVLLVFYSQIDGTISLADVLIPFNQTLIRPEISSLIQQLQIPLNKVRQNINMIIKVPETCLANQPLHVSDLSFIYPECPMYKHNRRMFPECVFESLVLGFYR